MDDEIYVNEKGELIEKPPVVDQNIGTEDHDDDTDTDTGDTVTGDTDTGDDTLTADTGTNTDHGDEELNAAADDAEREAIRERRRQERKNRKQAQRDREDSLRRELAARDSIINEMRTKLDAIERRNTGSEVAQLENAKKQTAQAYAYFKDQIRIATEAGNGAAVAEATEKMMQAQRKFDEINRYEQAYRQRAEQPQPLDPRLVNHAQKWMNENKWFDPTGKDTDSRIATVIDQQLAQEGWNPATPEYWKELSERVKKHLPHRVSRGNVGSTKPRSVVTGSGRESGSTQGQSSGGVYKLSSDRVQALKDAGMWDDPKQRAEAVKRFREYDKQHQGN